MLDTSVRITTVLRFSRAVKLHAESLGVWALFFATSCVSRGVEHVSVGPATGVVRAVREAPTTTPSNTPTQADAGPPSRGVASEPRAPSPSAGLSFEQPYPFDARPRTPDPHQAASDDEELARWNLGGTADPNYVSSQASFHPGTRVVVDTRVPGQRAGSSRSPSRTARGLTSDRIQAQARSKGYWPFRLCFEAGQREKKGLGGETLVRFTISARGEVSAARLVSSELHNAASAACLLSELRKLRFSPRPARHMEVVGSIRIWPGDAELPPISDAPPTIDVSNGFDPEAVRTRLVAKAGELEACFSEARRTDPSLWGRLALSVVLEVDGSVHRVNEVESHFPSAAAAHCAAAAVSRMVFPSVSGKPFNFVLALRLAPSDASQPGESNDDANRPSNSGAPSLPDGGDGPAD